MKDDKGVEKENINEKVPLVSVIIPVYNSENYLRECLDSVVNQTLKDIEIICVDDGSTDHSLGILREYAKKDPRVSILHQENRYAGVARNKGISAARGEFLVFLDADDFFEWTLLQKQYYQIKRVKADICICGADRYNNKTKKTEPSPWLLNRKKVNKTWFCAEDYPDHIFELSSCAPWNKIYRADFVKEHRLEYQDTQRANDVYFFMVAACLAKRITVLDEVLVHYRVGISENLQSNNKKSPTDYLKALNKVRTRLEEEGVYQKFEKCFFESVVNQSIYNLNSLGSPYSVAFRIVARRLRSEVLPSFRIQDRPKEFFLDPSGLERLLDLLDQSGMDFSEFRPPDSPKCGNSENRNRFDPFREKVTEPKVSVIIPVYNTEAYLPDCLESVLDQTLREIEIVCVNDGSPDRSLDILKKYAALDARVMVIDQDNQGPSCARNAGLNAASGEYVCFLDSDDMLRVDALEKLYATAKENGLEQLFFDAETFYEQEEIKEQFQSFDQYYHSGLTEIRIDKGPKLFAELKNMGIYRCSACLQLLSREFLNRRGLRFEPGILQEDNLFTFLCIFQAERAGKTGEAFYLRRIREDSIMTRAVSFRNVYGYLRCGIGMMEHLSVSDCSDSERESGSALAETMLKQANRLFGQLSCDEKKKSEMLSEDERKWLTASL